MTSKIIAATAAVVGVGLAAVTCAGAPASSRAASAAHVRLARAPTDAKQPAPPGRAGERRSALAAIVDGRRPFGPGCRILRHVGPGSEAALATAPVGTALSQAPALSELAHAIQQAGLTRMLNTASALTVFAPDNAAFDALGAGNLQALLATTADLVRVLKFAVVARRVAPAELLKRHVLTTVAGTKLYPARYGLSLSVNNSSVTCGNVRTLNATIYVVDRMIIPSS